MNLQYIKKERENSEWQRKYLKFIKENRNWFPDVINPHHKQSLTTKGKVQGRMLFLPNLDHLFPRESPTGNSEKCLSKEQSKKIHEDVSFLFFPISFFTDFDDDWKQVLCSQQFIFLHYLFLGDKCVIFKLVWHLFS